MSARRLFLDASPGEIRAVVTLDGLPERLFIERDGAPTGPRLGARYAARVSEIARDLGLAYLDLRDAGGVAGAQARAGRYPLPLDEQALGAVVQHHHRANLAGGRVEEQAPHAHGRRQPSPSSRTAVS